MTLTWIISGTIFTIIILCIRAGKKKYRGTQALHESVNQLPEGLLPTLYDEALSQVAYAVVMRREKAAPWIEVCVVLADRILNGDLFKYRDKVLVESDRKKLSQESARRSMLRTNLLQIAAKYRAFKNEPADDLILMMDELYSFRTSHISEQISEMEHSRMLKIVSDLAGVYLYGN